MKTHTTYKAKIAESHGAFGDTLALYRGAVDFFIDVVLRKWGDVSVLDKNLERQQLIERATHATNKRPVVEFTEFDEEFYKFPSYLRRAAISEALGMVSSYKSNLDNWKKAGSQGRSPSDPHAGFVCPALYKDGMFILTGGTHARIKVFKNGDWVWHDVQLRKSDMTYMERHCKNRKARIGIWISHSRRRLNSKRRNLSKSKSSSQLTLARTRQRRVL